MTRISGSLARRVQPQKDRFREQSKRGLPARAQKRCLSPSKMLTPAPTQYLAVVDPAASGHMEGPIACQFPAPDSCPHYSAAWPRCRDLEHHHGASWQLGDHSCQVKPSCSDPSSARSTILCNTHNPVCRGSMCAHSPRVARQLLEHPQTPDRAVSGHGHTCQGNLQQAGDKLAQGLQGRVCFLLPVHGVHEAADCGLPAHLVHGHGSRVVGPQQACIVQAACTPAQLSSARLSAPHSG